MAVIIITGDIDSGKTSWCRRKPAEEGTQNLDSVLLVKVFASGARVGYDAVRISSGETVPFTRRDGFCPENWDPEERIGLFSISRSGKEAANCWVCEAAANRDLIIDEVGLLELRGSGLAEGIHRALETAGQEASSDETVPGKRDVYLVVRKSCLEEVCRVFQISNYRLITIA